MFFDLETTGFDRPIRPVQVLKILDEGEGTVSKMAYFKDLVFQSPTQFNPICGPKSCKRNKLETSALPLVYFPLRSLKYSLKV